MGTPPAVSQPALCGALVRSPAAASHALVKMAPARYHADDVDVYYGVKYAVCDIIVACAE